MHATFLVLAGLAASASAIDILGYRGNNQCRGDDYIACNNANPGDCCIRASGDIYHAIGFRAIPRDWRINGVGYQGGDCRNVHYVAASNGADFVCAGGAAYSGGKYEFASKRRALGFAAAAAAAADACPASGTCGAVKRADLLSLTGVKYDLAAMDEDLYDEMVSDLPYEAAAA